MVLFCQKFFYEIVVIDLVTKEVLNNDVERFRELGDRLSQVTRRISSPMSDLLLSPLKLSQEAKEYRSSKIALTFACLFGAMEGLAIGGSIFQGDPAGWVAFRAISSWEALNVVSLAFRDNLNREIRTKRDWEEINFLFNQIKEEATRLRFPTIHRN